MSTPAIPIPLSPAEIALRFEYKNGHLYWKENRKNLIGKRAGTNVHGYIRIWIQGKAYSEHRLIFLLHRGYEPEFIDHINRDRADNRIENLREATTSLNALNRGYANNKSGVVGVYWYARGKQWQAIIQNKTLGRFKNFEDAVEARINAEIELVGSPIHKGNAA